MEYISVIVSETIFFIFHCSSTKEYNVLLVVQLSEIHNLYKDWDELQYPHNTQYIHENHALQNGRCSGNIWFRSEGNLLFTMLSVSHLATNWTKYVSWGNVWTENRLYPQSCHFIQLFPNVCMFSCFSSEGEEWMWKVHSCEHCAYSHQNIHGLEADTGAGEMAQGK